MTESMKELGATNGTPWKLIAKEKPSVYKNVLFAFEGHWNQVAGFYCGKSEYRETHAHGPNTKIIEGGPKWWTEIPEVPHRL